MSNIITIADVSIRQDDQGRYSLNDLHRAAGGEKRHQPSDWLRVQQTQDLVLELGNQIPGNPGIQSKQGLGTFVCKELVYAYAMWISAAFHLRVIRAYDAVVTGQAIASAIPQSLPEALRLAAEAIEERDRLALENQAKAEALAEAAPKVRALDRIASPTEGSVGVRIAAKLLQMPEKQFLQFANAEGYIFRNHHSRVWQGYADKAKAGLVEQKFTTIERDDGSTKVVEQVLITRLGIARLAEKLERRKACEIQAISMMASSTKVQSKPLAT